MGFPASVAVSPGLITRHGASCTKVNATQNVLASTETAVTWDTEQWDTDNYHDNVTNPSRFTVPAGLGGLYLCVFSVTIQGNATITGATNLYWKKNGNTNFNPQQSLPNSANNEAPLSAALIPLAAGDYLEAYCFQNSSVTRVIDNINNNQINIQLVSA